MKAQEEALRRSCGGATKNFKITTLAGESPKSSRIVFGNMAMACSLTHRHPWQHTRQGGRLAGRSAPGRYTPAAEANPSKDRDILLERPSSRTACTLLWPDTCICSTVPRCLINPPREQQETARQARWRLLWDPTDAGTSPQTTRRSTPAQTTETGKKGRLEGKERKQGKGERKEKMLRAGGFMHLTRTSPAGHWPLPISEAGSWA